MDGNMNPILELQWLPFFSFDKAPFLAQISRHSLDSRIRPLSIKCGLKIQIQSFVLSVIYHTLNILWLRAPASREYLRLFSQQLSCHHPNILL